MKILIRVVLILSILLLSTLFILLLPYFIYSTVLSSGINSEYLQIRPVESLIYGKQSFNFERLKGIYYEDDSRWDQVALSNFTIPFPVYHPQFHLNPILGRLTAKGDEVGFGVSYRDQEERVLVDFKQELVGKFNYDFISKHKLFSLPIFKNYILSKNNSEIWKDLFTKDLSTTFILRRYFAHRTIDQYLGDLLSTPYRELTYGLFIYLLRQEYLPAGHSEITFVEESKTGVVYLPPALGAELQEEQIFVLNNGLIYKAKIFSRLQSIQAEALRLRLLKRTSFHDSTESDAQSLYSRYKSFPYLDRIGKLGTSYLYAAWSHVPDDVKFLKELIYFLERGKNNSLPLQELYQFAYERYGNNFSQIEDRRKESFEQKMKRLQQEQLEEELQRERQRAGINHRDEFLTDEEKRDFYLQQAKDKKDQPDAESVDEAVENSVKEENFVTD